MPAMHECERCKKSYFGEVENCPNCGFPVKDYESKISKLVDQTMRLESFYALDRAL